MARLVEKAPASVEQLVRDPDLQDILALNLQRAVQITVDLAAHLIAEVAMPPPSTMAEHFDSLERLQIITPSLAQNLKKSVGFRNIAVHSYQTIDWAIVFRIVGQHLSDFKNFAQAVNERLEQR